MNDFPILVVRLIIKNAQNKVLILQRAESEYAGGSWCLPGGKVKYGDTVEQSAARELKEETSLICHSLRFLFYQDSLPLKPGGMHCVNFYFEAEVSGDIMLNEESCHFEWIGLSDLENYNIAYRNDTALIHYWKKTPGYILHG